MLAEFDGELLAGGRVDERGRVGEVGDLGRPLLRGREGDFLEFMPAYQYVQRDGLGAGGGVVALPGLRDAQGPDVILAENQLAVIGMPPPLMPMPVARLFSITTLANCPARAFASALGTDLKALLSLMG